jgi:hypothetical protein
METDEAYRERCRKAWVAKQADSRKRLDYYLDFVEGDV